MTEVAFPLAVEAGPFRRKLPGVRCRLIGVGAGDLSGLEGGDRLILAGFAGGLRPDLRMGDVLVPSEAVGPDGRVWPLAGESGRVVTSPTLVADTADKRRLRDATGADIVDMEASTVAAWAAERGVPLTVVRAVTDTAHDALSPALASLLAGPRVRLTAVLGFLLAGRVRVSELLRLRRAAAVAGEALAERLTRLLGGRTKGG